MVGSRQNKIDGMAAVLGKALYVEDVSPRDPLCVMLLRSPHAHAEIRSINTEKALRLDGVECILTHRDVRPVLHTIAAEAYPEGSPYDRILLGTRVRFVGDPVAVVAAKDRESAEAALAAIEVEYTILPAVLDFESAIDHPVVLHPAIEVRTLLPIDSQPDRNIAAGFPWSHGDVDSRLAACDAVVQGTYHVPAQLHAMMETHRASCYQDARGHLVITSSCQSPFHVQRIVSNLIGVNQHEIRVIKPKVGGAFGGKNSVFIEAFVALVTLKTGKSCMMVFDRRESLEATNTRHQIRSRITLGADRRDGIIKAARLEVLSNTGAYGEHCIDVLAVACKNTLPIYGGVEALEYNGTAVYTNKVPAGAFRGFGAPQVNFGLESLVDELAEKLGLDPIGFRLRNIIKTGQTHPFLSGGGPAGDAAIKSTALERCILRGARMIDWGHKYPRRRAGPDRVIGVGCSIAMHGSSIALMDVVEAEVRLNYDGSFSLFTGAADLGTGAETILMQYVGQVLSVPMDRIRIVAADTETTPCDKGAYASSTTYATGNAVVAAARKLKAQIEEAARLVTESDTPLFFDDSRFADAGGETRISLKDFLVRVNYYKRGGDYFTAEEIPQLSASARYGSRTAPPPYVAGFAEIEVDTGTGELRVLKFVAVADCGTVINPALARIQLEGGIVMGLGYALQEDVVYSESGGMESSSFLKYRIPCIKDVPVELETAFEESYEPDGPFGAKSLGEVVVHTPPAAIANALYNATGARVRSLPITPDKVLRAFAEKEASR